MSFIRFPCAHLTVDSHQFDYLGSGSIKVNADRDKINSVLSNLINNAVKYSPKGKFVRIQCTGNGSETIVSVNDEGMGIKPEDIGHIFDRYYRGSNRHTQQIGGFGIGLYLSAEIVRQHNGKIWAES